jgi:pimeloyl-ACP methyl ester carboxylesterase
MNDSSVPMEGGTRVGRASVHWRRVGSGPMIVFLNGFPLSGRTWDGVVAVLRDRFSCWTLDLIGLGESRSAADEDHSSAGQARPSSPRYRRAASTPMPSSATTPAGGSPVSSPSSTGRTCLASS